MDFKNKKLLFIGIEGTLVETASKLKNPIDITDFKIRKNVLDLIVMMFPKLMSVELFSNKKDIKRISRRKDLECQMRTIECFIQGYLRNRNEHTIFVHSSEVDATSEMAHISIGYDEILKAYSSWDKNVMVMIGSCDKEELAAHAFGIDYMDIKDFLYYDYEGKDRRNNA